MVTGFIDCPTPRTLDVFVPCPTHEEVTTGFLVCDLIIIYYRLDFFT